jgi:hypothetical protein
MANRGWFYCRTSPQDTRGSWIIPSGRSEAAVSGWVARNHHRHGLVASISMTVGGCWGHITEREREGAGNNPAILPCPPVESAWPYESERGKAAYRAKGHRWWAAS